ncbi:MAG: hypothetical protein J5J06_16450 [Phycisphaerae bacterium]|nr:hypothetical protein [Phycisphaerae bacterium]
MVQRHTQLLFAAIGLVVIAAAIIAPAPDFLVPDTTSPNRASVQPAPAPDPVRGPSVGKPERATHPDEAMRWRRLRWRDENGEIAKDALRIALAQREANADFWLAQPDKTLAGIDPDKWMERGPNNVGGRTRSLVIHPLDPNTLWAGAVSGGIWQSVDRGATWAPVNDWLPNLAICSMAISPLDPDLLYAGTGEGFFNGDALGGAGVYRSTDGGVNWFPLLSTANWENVNRIAVSPDVPDTLLAATLYGGIRRSTDRGRTWTNPLPAQGSYYVAYDPTNGNNAVGHILDYDWDVGD